MSKNTIKVVELFAGVGGFRIGLEGASDAYETIWNNQWEPSTKHQDASLVYRARFGSKGHSNQDINTVPTADIPDHDLLVGGFPCQFMFLWTKVNVFILLVNKMVFAPMLSLVCVPAVANNRLNSTRSDLVTSWCIVVSCIHTHIAGQMTQTLLNVIQYIRHRINVIHIGGIHGRTGCSHCSGQRCFGKEAL